MVAQQAFSVLYPAVLCGLYPEVLSGYVVVFSYLMFFAFDLIFLSILLGLALKIYAAQVFLVRQIFKSFLDSGGT